MCQHARANKVRRLILLQITGPNLSGVRGNKLTGAMCVSAGNAENKANLGERALGKLATT